jgi:hypothetical protein
MQRIEAKPSWIFINLFPLFKIELLNANIKLNLLKALIRSVMTYACVVWEFAVEFHLFKLQRL